MKRFYFFLLLILSVSRVLGQDRYYNRTDWGVAQQAPCFSNLYVSYRSTGYEPSVSAYGYNWRIENRSEKRVSFTFGPWIVAADGKTKEKMLGGLFTLDPGQVYTHTPGYSKILPQRSTMEFFITAYSDVKGGPSYNCVNGSKVCVSNCGGTGQSTVNGSNANSKMQAGEGNGSTSGLGTTSKTITVKPNTGELTLQASRGNYSVRGYIDKVQCPGTIRVGMEPDSYEGKKLTIYALPSAASGTFVSDNGAANCTFYAMLTWFESGKYRYTTPIITLTKTGPQSFTFTGTLSSGEKISGSGNFILQQ